MSFNAEHSNTSTQIEDDDCYPLFMDSLPPHFDSNKILSALASFMGEEEDKKIEVINKDVLPKKRKNARNW